jgi:magnesium chelatase family protein
MSVATCKTISLHGATGHLIDVQTDVSAGVVGTTIVGRADTSLQEARERCRKAVHNSGLDWPATRRVTILLAPADLPKAGTHFDLALAISVLAASDQVPVSTLADTLFVGELTLSGGLRSVPGVLPMTLAARDRGLTRVVVPEPQACEAAMVPGMQVVGLRSLGQVVAQLRGEELPTAPPVAEMGCARLLSWRGQDQREQTDLADLVGIPEARYAAEVAVAGGHHLMLSGPKGSGKTSLAERLPGLMPDLEPEEALELTAIHSLAGALGPADELIFRPPYCAPHHDASRASLIGGGTGRVRPGELSRAHTGVLFLDEFPLFAADVIEALRQPLEEGEVTIARGEETVTYPARGIVVLACNPCPCGNYHAKVSADRCTCREVDRRRYRRKLTGPIVDRIDIVRHLEPVGPHQQRDRFAVRESSAQIRARVGAARGRQADRYVGLGWRLNAHVPGPVLREEWPLTAAGERLLDDHVYSGALTRRGQVRVHRLALTVADLRGAERPEVRDVAMALGLRLGEPLRLEHLAGVG